MKVTDIPAGVRLARLWVAICYVESTYNEDAYREDTKARGIGQQTPIFLEDVVLLLGNCGNPWEENKARENYFVWMYRRLPKTVLWDERVTRNRYERVTQNGYPCVRWRGSAQLEEYASRCYFGGPTGYRKASTLPYWQKVKRVLDRMQWPEGITED